MVVLCLGGWCHAGFAAEAPALSATIINGSSTYTSLQLYPAYQKQLGQRITRESAQAILAALTEMYVGDGYVRPDLSINDELMAQGILRIDVYEPRIAQVVIKGDPGPHAPQLEKLASGLQQEPVVRDGEIQRVIQRMREMPGLTVIASTELDETRRNSYVLLIDASYSPVDGMVRVTNRGTNEVGPLFLLSQITANSLFRADERAGLTVSSTVDPDEYFGGGLFIEEMVGQYRTRGMLTAFRSVSHPDDPRLPIPDTYERERLALNIVQPLESFASQDASLSAALEFDDLTIERTGFLLRDDRLRVLELGGRTSWRSGSARQNVAMLQVRHGIDAFGARLASTNPQDALRRADFLLTRMQYIHLSRLDENWSARLDILLQHSTYVLPYGERFKIGGDRLGRGLEVPEVAGDSGAGGKIELRRQMTSLESAVGRTSVYGFYDLGATWKQDVDGRESAATAGTGISVDWKNVSGYVEVAAPLTHPDVDGSTDPRVFTEFSLRF